MTEATAGNMPATVLSSFGEYGLAGLIILILFVGIYKFANRWIDITVEREKRDADIRKSTYEALNGITAALTANTEAAKHHACAVDKLFESVGRLPCAYRDT